MSANQVRFNTGLQRNWKQIIACNRHLATILPVRVSYDANMQETGLVLARNSVSTVYSAYDSGGASGLDVAKAVLLDTVYPTDFAATSGTALANAVFGGELYVSKLIGYDSGALTDLGGKVIIDATGVEILKF